MKRKKAIAWLLSASMLLSVGTPVAWAAPQSFGDIEGHWAQAAIERWSGYDVVSGDSGMFRPNESLTRGQMATILSNLLGLTKESAKNPFGDVAADAWYYSAVLRCYEAGILSGDGQNANPNGVLTRQEAMAMIARALKIAPVTDADLSAYTDGGAVAPWAAGYLAAMVEKGILSGVGDNTLAPALDMSRAAIMTVLNKSVVQYINAPGTYPLTDGEGIILVASGDVVLTGETKADLLVTEAAEGKTVTFDKAMVGGQITVQAPEVQIVAQESTLPEIQTAGAGSTAAPAETTPAETAEETPAQPSGGGGGGSSSGNSNVAPADKVVPEDMAKLLGLKSGVYDTDRDGLCDYDEIYIVGTDPVLWDTDGDGKNDAKSDEDEDGLTNLQEIRMCTNPLQADTDFDGLTDYEEIYTYNTNPQQADTDGDRLQDGDEIVLGLDPLKDKTDGVTLDSERVITQKLKRENIDDLLFEKNAAIPSLEAG
ncbi:MAG: S-layer homology domain-containing protein, partial [Bacillota bacterium]|nr:S-layer homology domain-containing protein [Bacillota bacterium]